MSKSKKSEKKEAKQEHRLHLHCKCSECKHWELVATRPVFESSTGFSSGAEQYVIKIVCSTCSLELELPYAGAFAPHEGIHWEKTDKEPGI